MFNRKIFGWLFAVSPSLVLFAAAYLLAPAFTTAPASAQISNPGIQQSGAVTVGNCAVWGPGVGQVQDGGNNCSGAASVTSVFGRTGAVVAAANDYNFNQLAGAVGCGQLPAFTGNVTNASCVLTIGSNQVTYAMVQQVAASRLLGNATGSAANVAEIPLGTGMAFSGGALVSTVIGGQASSPACVRMWPSSGQTTAAWNVIDAYGNAVTTAGTTSQGLQEAINFSVYNGQCLRVYGGGPIRIFGGNGSTHTNTVIDGISSTTGMLAGDYVTGPGIPGFTTIVSVDSGTQITVSNATTATATVAINVTRGAGANLNNYIASSATITVPPAEQWDAQFYQVNLTFSTTVTGPGLQFNSCMICNFNWSGGQIVYQPNTPLASSYAVYFNPTLAVPLDGLIGITGSSFYISNLAAPASGGTAAAVWGFNIANGGIDTSTFGSVEINGTGTGLTANTDYGIVVFGVTASTAFQQNTINVTNIHISKTAAIQIGTSSTNAGNYRGNTWNIGGINPSGASSDGINTFGSFDKFNIGQITNQQGTLNNGVVIEPGAVKNSFEIGEISGAAGAAIVNGNPGGLNTILYDGSRAPKVTVYTSGSGTFTTQPWTRILKIKMVGGGAGGNGSGGTPGTGTAGGNTTFGALAANGGNHSAGAGGTASGGDLNIQGGQGQGSVPTFSASLYGGSGGVSCMGGNGVGVAGGAGGGGGSNTGSGGAGGGGNTGSGVGSAAAGSAGGCLEKIYVTGLAATYSYAVGAGGTAGSAGSNGFAGGAGGAGYIMVVEEP